MEFFQEIFLTAFAALLFSYFVAKLVSKAIGFDDGRGSVVKSSESARGGTVVEVVKFDGGLRVQSTESKRRVQFVEEGVEQVYQFERETMVDKSEESGCSGEFEDERCDSAVLCASAGRIEVGQIVGLPEDGRLMEEEEDVAAEPRCSYGFEEKRCDSAVTCDSAGRIEVGAGAGLPGTHSDLEEAVVEESRCRDKFEEKRCDSAVMSYSSCRIEVGEVVGLRENLSDGRLMEEEVSAEEAHCIDELEDKRCDEAVTRGSASRIELPDNLASAEQLTGKVIFSGTEVNGIKEEDAGTNLVRLVVEEGGERTEEEESDEVKEENASTGFVAEEAIIVSAQEDGKIAAGSSMDDIVGAQGAEVGRMESRENQGIGSKQTSNERDEKEDLVGNEEDDWEGIERSELEEVFAKAATYVASGSKDHRMSNVGGDVQMQLYGLHKVAMEGPCYEPKPMALKVSARAKWNAWQRLGNMNPEDAMEQYVTLLSDKVPGWTEGKSSGDDNAGSLVSGISAPPYPNKSTYPHNQLYLTKREIETDSGIDGGGPTGGSDSLNKG